MCSGDSVLAEGSRVGDRDEEEDRNGICWKGRCLQELEIKTFVGAAEFPKTEEGTTAPSFSNYQNGDYSWLL